MFKLSLGQSLLQLLLHLMAQLLVNLRNSNPNDAEPHMQWPAAARRLKLMASPTMILPRKAHIHANAIASRVNASSGAL